MPEPNEGTIVKAARTTGYWTQGIVTGSVLFFPVMIVLVGSLGFLLMLIRNIIIFGGRGGVD